LCLSWRPTKVVGNLYDQFGQKFFPDDEMYDWLAMVSADYEDLGPDTQYIFETEYDDYYVYFDGKRLYDDLEREMLLNGNENNRVSEEKSQFNADDWAIDLGKNDGDESKEVNNGQSEINFD